MKSIHFVSILILLVLSCFFYSCSSSGHTRDRCGTTNSFILFSVVSGSEIEIYNTDSNYSTTTLADVEDNSILLSHSELDLSYGSVYLNTPNYHDEDTAYGRRPSPITLSWVQDDTNIQLQLNLDRGNPNNSEFVSFITVTDGDVVEPEEEDYQQVQYGESSITLDIVYDVESVTGRFQGTLVYTEEERSVDYPSVTCRANETDWRDEYTYDCSNGETYLLGSERVTCSPNSDDVPSVSSDVNLTVNSG